MLFYIIGPLREAREFLLYFYHVTGVALLTAMPALVHLIDLDRVSTPLCTGVNTVVNCFRPEEAEIIPGKNVERSMRYMRVKL
jgi:hypothetical protein